MKCCWIVFGIFTFPTVCLAQVIPSIPSEFVHERHTPTADIDMLSTNIAGEQISLATGTPIFSVTDVSIPVSRYLSVDIARYYNRLSGQNLRQYDSFGDWGLDIPRIESTYVQGDNRFTNNYDVSSVCSQALTPGPIMGALGQNIESFEYFNGVDIIIPGKDHSKLSQSLHGGDYMSDNFIRVSCHVDGNAHEYFRAQTPDGYTYEFKERMIQVGFPLVKDFKSAPRNKIIYAVSQIQDIAGNKLQYQYDSGRLVSVSYVPVQGSVETVVQLTHDSDSRVTEVTTGNKTWQYEYTGNNLTKVTLPDNTAWLLNFPDFIDYGAKISLAGTYTSSNRECLFSTGPFDKYISIRHPKGALVELNLAMQVHGRTDVPASYNAIDSGSGSIIYNVNACSGHIAVTTKTVSGPGLAEQIWSYSYTNNGSHWLSDEFSGTPSDARLNSDALVDDEKFTECSMLAECSEVPNDLGFAPYDLRVLTVTAPNNQSTKYYISKRFDFTEGEVVAQAQYSAQNQLL